MGAQKSGAAFEDLERTGMAMLGEQRSGDAGLRAPAGMEIG